MPPKKGSRIKPHFWTEERNAFLAEHYSMENIDMLAEHFGKSRQSIMARASRMKLNSGRYLTEYQRNLIEEHPEKSNQKLCELTGKNELSIRHARYNHSVSLKDANFDKLTCAEIGRLVGKGRDTITKCWCRAKNTERLKYKRIGRRYIFVDINDLLDYMQRHPEKWDATKCEKWFFENYQWFQEKRKIDMQKMIDKRWNAV